MALRDHFEDGWWTKLSPFLTSDKFKKITDFLVSEVNSGKTLTPLFYDIFRAFKECPYKDLKVVFLGQDPYPWKGVADGLAFSARNKPLDPPATLRYMWPAIETDVYGGFAIGYNEEFWNTDLTRWAKQGVLLINTALTTTIGVSKAEKHAEAWAPFIRYLFLVLKAYNTGLVFILLGNDAKMWKVGINAKSNYILTAYHPAHCAHSGIDTWDCNKVFSTTNEILKSNNKTEILW